jgi:hypothetical protein
LKNEDKNKAFIKTNKTKGMKGVGGRKKRRLKRTIM